MSYVRDVKGRVILDSRGTPTVEVDVHLTSGAWGRAAVPSGASTGTREALELRDNDPKQWMGKGVSQALQSIANVLAPELRGMNALDQPLIDSRMLALDGTPTKARLGANAVLGVSLAVARAAAVETRQPLYLHRRGQGT